MDINRLLTGSISTAQQSRSGEPCCFGHLERLRQKQLVFAVLQDVDFTTIDNLTMYLRHPVYHRAGVIRRQAFFQGPLRQYPRKRSCQSTVKPQIRFKKKGSSARLQKSMELLQNTWNIDDVLQHRRTETGIESIRTKARLGAAERRESQRRCMQIVHVGKFGPAESEHFERGIGQNDRAGGDLT